MTKPTENTLIERNDDAEYWRFYREQTAAQVLAGMVAGSYSDSSITQGSLKSMITVSRAVQWADELIECLKLPKDK